MQMKSKNRNSVYYLHKLTNSIIKWTGIITYFCLDKAR